jgi:hypothetical protein
MCNSNRASRFFAATINGGDLDLRALRPRCALKSGVVVAVRIPQ